MPHARLLTPLGEAALAVVRIDGPDAAAALDRLGVAPPPPRGAPALRTLRIGETLRERALVVADRDGFEIHLHGNPLLAREVLALCGDASRTPATLREEVLRVAAAAPSQRGLARALAQLGDDGLVALAGALAGGRAAAAEVAAALDAGTALAPLYEPARVVLAGRTNAGKSTLFNLLAGRERVRAGPEPALTRDPVEELVVLDGWPVVVVDTAGEGACGTLDSAALEQGREEAAAAALVLRIVAPGDPVPAPATGEKRLFSHADRAPAPCAGPGEPVVDLTAAATRDGLVPWLVGALGLSEPDAGPAWLNGRQHRLLVAAHAALGRGDGGLAAKVAADLLLREG